MDELDYDAIDEMDDVAAPEEYSPVALYVLTTFNPDMREVLFHVDNVFAKFQSGHHLRAIELLLLEELNVEDPVVLKNKVLSLYDESLKEALAAFGIGVHSDCRDYQLLADMLDALALAQFQYSKDFIEPLLAIDEVEGEEYTYANLVAALTPSRAEAVMEILLDFKPALITTLKEIVGRHEDSLDEVAVETSKREALSRYRTFLRGRRYGLVFDVARRSVGYGLLGWKELYLLVEDDLEGLTDNVLAYEMVSLLLVSNLEDEKLEETLTQVAGLFKDTHAQIRQFTEQLKAEWLGE